MIIKRETIRQLKKFVSGTNEKEEDLYLYVNDDKEIYIVNFHKVHVYLSYLKLGETEELGVGVRLIQGEYAPLRKYLNKVRVSDLLYLTFDETGADLDLYDIKSNESVNHRISWTNEDIRLDLSYFIEQRGNEYHIRKKDFKCIGLYKDNCSKICIGNGTITFKFYHDKEHIVHAKHVICDTYDNQDNGCFHAHNIYLLRLLDKFINDEVITLWLSEDKPLFIESDDYIGLLAPRILFDGDIEERI